MVSKGKGKVGAAQMMFGGKLNIAVRLDIPESASCKQNVAKQSENYPVTLTGAESRRKGRWLTLKKLWGSWLAKLKPVSAYVAAIILTHTFFAFVKNDRFETSIMKEGNSLLSDDWPPFSPLAQERVVERVVGESVHYAPVNPGQRTSGGPKGASASTARDASAPAIGRSPRLYKQLTNRTNDNRVPHHQHCLNYLREQALCRPDLTLEPGDFASRNFEVDSVRQTHTCRDFETAWDYNTRSWLDWYCFLKENS
ncbi:hypothetical protein V8E53_013007 [Lactarius tabidus]